jgi:hypothetical protein
MVKSYKDARQLAYTEDVRTNQFTHDELKAITRAAYSYLIPAEDEARFLMHR